MNVVNTRYQMCTEKIAEDIGCDVEQVEVEALKALTLKSEFVKPTSELNFVRLKYAGVITAL